MNEDLWLVLGLAALSALAATLSGAQVVGIVRLRQEYRTRLASITDDYVASDDAALREDEIEVVFAEPPRPRGFPAPEYLSQRSPLRQELILERLTSRVDASRNRQLAITTISTVAAGAVAWPLGSFALREFFSSLNAPGIFDAAYARSLGAMMLLVIVVTAPIGASVLEPAIRANAKYWRRQYQQVVAAEGHTM